MNYNYSSNEGKRLPTLDNYANLLLPMNISEDEIKINPLGAMTEDKDDYLVVQIGNGKFRLMPGPEFSPRLYRGQSCNPPICKASLYRTNQYSKYILNNIKLYEFYKLICLDPAVKYMSNLKILEQSFSVDFEGLAQHYELSTGMLDFSRSKDIAMFFAFCTKNMETNCYEPIWDETRDAVIYTLDIKKMFDSGEKFNVIGMQPLLRPYRQKALSIRQGGNDNLNTKAYIEKNVIKIDRVQSMKYFEMFDGGAKLFPLNDIVYRKACEIKESNEIDKEVVEHMLSHGKFPMKITNETDLIHLLKNENISIGDKTKELSFSQEEISLMGSNWLKIEDELMSKIKMRLWSDSI